MAKLSDLVGPQQAAIQQIVDEFMLLTGWAPGLDAADLAQFVVDNGLAAQPGFAFELMFQQKLPDWAKSVVPWAEFGLTEMDYHSKLASLKSTYYDLTGGDIPAPLAAQSFRENWTAEQLKHHITVDPKYKDDNPWAETGQTYTQARESYMSQYGQAPADLNTLKGWWGFQRQAKQVGSGGEAVVSTGAPASGQQKPSDTEIR